MKKINTVKLFWGIIIVLAVIAYFAIPSNEGKECELKINVYFTGGSFEVENKSDGTQVQIKMEINDTYKYTLQRLPKGETVTIPMNEFASKSGLRMSSNIKPLEVFATNGYCTYFAKWN